MRGRLGHPELGSINIDLSVLKFPGEYWPETVARRYAIAISFCVLSFYWLIRPNLNGPSTCISVYGLDRKPTKDRNDYMNTVTE